MTSGKWIKIATRFRYSFPVLAELHRDQGSKYITLVRRLESSDRAIRQALDYLMSLELVDRNPGYGHPSRPEYILTNEGQELAPICLEVWNELGRWQQLEVAMERWPLPVLDTLNHGETRYTSILKSEPDLSPRALTIALDRLIDAGLVQRTVVDGRPPVTQYQLTNWGRQLGEILAKL